MARKQYPRGKVIAKIFLDSIRDYENTEIISEGEVCHIRIDNIEYYLYFKCVTHEGNPYPLEHQRAQLPYREEFETIKSSDVTFLFLGYDVDNDLFVCWEPHKVKPRLNKKKYVSFYSRLSVQQSVIEGEIKEELLTNGDKFVLFKRKDSLSFLHMIDQHFAELKGNSTVPSITDGEQQGNTGDDLIGKIQNIDNDESVKLLVDSMKGNSSTLQIISACMNEFGDFYSRMSLLEWNKVVKKYLSTTE